MSRRSIYVDGLSHGTNPIPAAAVVRGILASGGISGMDRSTGEIPVEVGDQVRNMFDNLAAVLEAAGGSVDDVVRIDVTLLSADSREPLNAEWVTRFPDEATRPARKTDVGGSLPPGMAVQCLVVAVLP